MSKNRHYWAWPRYKKCIHKVHIHTTPSFNSTFHSHVIIQKQIWDGRTNWRTKLMTIVPIRRSVGGTNITYLNLTCKIHTPVTYHETKKILIVLQRTYHGKKLIIWHCGKGHRIEAEGEADRSLRPLFKNKFGWRFPLYLTFFFSFYTLFESQNIIWTPIYKKKNWARVPLIF